MASTSPSELAAELLDCCIAGSPWRPEALDLLAAQALSSDEEISGPASAALFRRLIEPLADLFEPRLCDAYADLFACVIEKAVPQWKAPDLAARYRAIREVRPVTRAPLKVFVLSRVTLGADVAITSIVMDAARQRFPDAELWFVGPLKAWELFEKAPDFRHIPVAYGRSGFLRDRLAVWSELEPALSEPGSLVLDPDSRLSQLGLLPVCPAENHYLFESRSFGGASSATLPQLTRAWCRDVLGVEDAQPWLHPKYSYDFGPQPVATVSLGVGENPAKRLPGDFETRLLECLAGSGRLVMVDAGAPGSEEEQRVREAIERSGLLEHRVGLHEGSFASFAAMIAASELYTGYDSAGQHVAAALSIPLITILAGAPCPRFAARWRPDSTGPVTVLPAASADPESLLAEISETAARR